MQHNFDLRENDDSERSKACQESNTLMMIMEYLASLVSVPGKVLSLSAAALYMHLLCTRQNLHDRHSLNAELLFTSPP